MNKKINSYGTYIEAIAYPAMLLVLMWLVYWAEQVVGRQLVDLGLRPHSLKGLIGILTMPLLHAPHEMEHIINNSIPTAVLLSALIFFYRDVALKVFVLSWLGTGSLLWLIAQNEHSVHIGMSGVIFSLFGFLFVSGFMRDVKNLQVLTLLVGFLYGSMIWGILPVNEGISWEGHLSGLLVGVTLSIIYRKHGPQRSKLQYEIEKELGIEPPDLEGQWMARQEEIARIQEEMFQRQQQAMFFVYDYVPKQQAEQKPPVDSDDESSQSHDSIDPTDPDQIPTE